MRGIGWLVAGLVAGAIGVAYVTAGSEPEDDPIQDTRDAIRRLECSPYLASGQSVECQVWRAVHERG